MSVTVGPVDIESSICYGCFEHQASVTITATECMVALRLCSACADDVLGQLHTHLRRLRSARLNRLVENS